MRRFLLALACLLFCGTANAAVPICLNQLGSSYWILTDDNPSSNVWDVANGVSVVNTNSGYQTWLAGQNPCPVTSISNAADNGGGLIRLTVNSTGQLLTNQYWTMYGSGTAADGVYKITVIDSTTVDLVASTFSGAFTTGLLYGSPIGTTATMFATIDTYNSSTWVSNTVSVISSATDVTLTNPLPSVIFITMTTTGKKVILPPMNRVGGVPIGKQFIIAGDAGSNIFDVYKNDGSTLLLFQTNPNDDDTFVLSANTTANGTVSSIGRSFATPIRTGVGGTGDTGSAYTTYTPTITSGTGTITTSSASGRYKTLGKTVWLELAISITTNGTGAGYVQATLPGALSAAAGTYVLVGKESGVSNKSLSGLVAASPVAVTIQNYDGSYPGADGATIIVSGSYEQQ